MTAWSCAWCARDDLDTVAWGFTFDARAVCRDCVERHGVQVHQWVQVDPKRVVTDLGEAAVDTDAGVVTLSWPLMRRAVYVGVDRRMSALQKGRRDAHGFSGRTAWDVDIEGAAAELAACVWLGLEWHPVVGALDTDVGDLGDGRQVRSTPYATGHLLLHESDHSEHRFVLVVGRAPRLRIAGWCLGREGKQLTYWMEPEQGRPCYAVPQEHLRALPRGVASRAHEPAEPAEPAAVPASGRSDQAGHRHPSAGEMPGVSDDSPF